MFYFYTIEDKEIKTKTMEKQFTFSKEVMRRADLAIAMIDDIHRLGRGGGCTKTYISKIEKRALQELKDAGFIGRTMLQGEVSKHAIRELRELTKPDALKIKDTSRS